MPIAQDLHYDKLLSDLSISYSNQELISEIVLPTKVVPKQTDKYLVYDNRSFVPQKDDYSGGSETRGIDWSFSDDGFYCDGHGLHHTIPYDTLANTDVELMDLHTDAAIILKDIMLLNKELDAAKVLRDVNSYDPDHVYNVAGPVVTLDWSDDASDPHAHLVDARTRVLKATGKRLNTLIMGHDVYERLRVHPKLLSRVFNQDVNFMTEDMLKLFLEVDTIVVGSATSRTSETEKTGDFIWGQDCIFSYIPPSVARKSVVHGVTFKWNRNGLGVEQSFLHDVQLKHSQMVELFMYYDHKVISKLAAVYFPAVLG